LEAKSIIRRNAYAAWASMALLFGVYAWLWYRAEGPAGGQDSWNHFLYARWAPFHSELLLDQWGKPLFTLLALPFAPMGIDGLYALNMLATLGTAWLGYMTARRLGLRNPWMFIPLFGLQPLVLANVHSALTEPSNALMLVAIVYLLASRRLAAAAVLGSFLPFMRTEGFILLGAMFLFLWVRSRARYAWHAGIGTLVFAVLGAAVSGDWAWIVRQNPYVKQEEEKRFDPGHGGFWHYAEAQREIWGPLVSVLVLASLVWVLVYVFSRMKKKTPRELSQMALWLWWPLFLSFFLAHSWVWYSGTYGSHGLLRVFVVVAPLAAFLAHYSLHRLMIMDVAILNRILKVGVLLALFLTAYPGAHFSYPWESKSPISGYAGATTVQQGLDFIRREGLLDSQAGSTPLLVHQLPELNAELDFDPWAAPDQAKSYYMWSIDKRPGQDWMPKGTVLLWDNFHARRDAPMSLHELRALGTYQELAYFPSDVDSVYDVRIFLKTQP
jgi:hypothetical protein